MRRLQLVSVVPTNSDRPSTPHRHPSNPFRTVISLRLKVTKRFHYVRSSSRAKQPLSAATIAKRKRSKYGHFRPPPLANELAMMQFADGGSLDSHIKRVMEAQARAAAGSGGASVGVAGVYRDEQGGIWWDEDEELEYAHLLDGLDRIKAEGDAEEALWEDFSRLSTHSRRPSSAANSSVDPSYDDSLSFGSSVDSDLNPKFLLPPPESETYPTFTSGTPNDRVLASLRIGGEGMSSLSLPLRPSRQAPHLLQSISLEDVQAFAKNSEPYTSLRLLSSEGSIRRAKPKGAARRRPAPLKPSLSYTRHPNGLHHIGPAASPLGGLHLEMVNLRKEFIDDSFTPPPSSSTTLFTTTRSSNSSCPSSLTRRNSRKSKSSVKKSSSSLNIRGLFARRAS